MYFNLKGTVVQQPHKEWEDEEDDTNIHKPQPTQFVSKIEASVDIHVH